MPTPSCTCSAATARLLLRRVVLVGVEWIDESPRTVDPMFGLATGVLSAVEVRALGVAAVAGEEAVVAVGNPQRDRHFPYSGRQPEVVARPRAGVVRILPADRIPAVGSAGVEEVGVVAEEAPGPWRRDRTGSMPRSLHYASQWTAVPQRVRSPHTDSTDTAKPPKTDRPRLEGTIPFLGASFRLGMSHNRWVEHTAAAVVVAVAAEQCTGQSRRG